METLNNIVLTIQNLHVKLRTDYCTVRCGPLVLVQTWVYPGKGFGEGMKRTFGGLFSKKGEAGADGMSSFQAFGNSNLQHR